MAGTHHDAWLQRLAAERDDLRAALAWACEHGEAEIGLRLVSALHEVWELWGQLSEGRRWLERLLAPGPGATGGVTLGGHHFGAATNGEPGRLRTTRIAQRGGVYSVSLPPASAALLTLR